MLHEGQVVWMNGGGQTKHNHQRMAIYYVDPYRSLGVIYRIINLETFQKIQTCSYYYIYPDTSIIGPGLYYTPGEEVTDSEIVAALFIAESIGNREAVVMKHKVL